MKNNDYLVTFSSIIIDDILLWNGEITLGVLGGGGTHAIAGCRVWWDNVAISFPVGAEDYDLIRDDLVAMGIDLSGVQVIKKNTLRHWQIFYHDGTRIEISRDPRIEAQYDYNRIPDFETLPELFSTAAGYHIQCRYPEKLVTRIKEFNPQAVFVYEPYTPEKDSDHKKKFSEILRLSNAFSPNLNEATIITGKQDPVDMVKVLLDWGANWVIIRMGENGSLSGTRDGVLMEVPPAPANLVDPTGAGNSFMGGLLYGITQGFSTKESLAAAAVSASFAIEQYGVAKRNVEERDKRFKYMLENIKVRK